MATIDLSASLNLTTDTIAQHRIPLTNAIDPNVAMHPYQISPRKVQYMGLWGTWVVDDGEPDTVCILLATTYVNPRVDTSSLSVVRLCDIPWYILQIQTVNKSPATDNKFWVQIQTILADDLRLENDNATRCGSRRLVFDSKQQNQKVREFVDNELL